MGVIKAKKCPKCLGSGRNKNGSRCRKCGGTGEVVISAKRIVGGRNLNSGVHL